MGDQANNQSQVGKIHIPYFNPEKKDISAKAWLYMVDMAQIAAGDNVNKVDGVETRTARWDDKVTVNNAMLLLQGSANKWMENLLIEDAPEIKSWIEFKKIFRKRFIKNLTLTEKLNLMELKMKSNESCDEFYDRCKNNYNLFFEDEWESLALGKTDADRILPWGNPGTEQVAAVIKVSDNYYKKAKEIQLKMSFAAGLKDSIKKQTLIQEADSLDRIVEVAKRVETSLKEVNKEFGAASCEIDQEGFNGEVGAVNNFRGRGKFQRGGRGGGQNRGGQRQGARQGGFKCFYCFKEGHYKDQCNTRKHDRAKGIFKSNIEATPNKGRGKINQVDGEDEEEEEEESGSVQNNQVDFNINEYLNLHRV